ncbi:MAG TPA: ABC transporter permease [Vicinamibacterales bacterium]|nr:ABC transporter permease [Vicinamibacterales bacterium]
MLQDLRYAIRTLRQAPGFTAAAVLALALGIGANTAVFSVVDAVLLKPLPYPEPDRLVRLYEGNPGEGIDRGEVSAGTFADWRARSRTLEGLAAYAIPFNGETLWTIGDRVQVVKTATASPGLFDLLRVRPILGRPLSPEAETVAPGAVGQFVIGYGLWQRAFGGDREIAGRRVMLEGRLPREIVGVMPRGFAFPDGTDAWTSLPIGPVPPAQRRSHSFGVLARIAPGRTIEDVRRELGGISTQLQSEQPASNKGWIAQIEPLAGSDSASTRLALIALLAAVAGVLLIGCANVANLLFARAAGRRQETAVRMALGAGWRRLVRQCLTEAALLCGAGVAAGLAIGYWIARVLVRLAPSDIPRLSDVGINAAVLVFALAAGVACTVLTGLAPALQAARAEFHGGVRRDARTATATGARVRRWLTGVQVAVVLTLLAGALLFVRTFVNLRGVDLGFHPAHVMEVEARWPVGRLFQAAPGQRPWVHVQQAVDGLMAAVEAVPGVDAAGLVTQVPLATDPASGGVWPADAPGATGSHPPTDPRDRWQADLVVVTPGYFRALEIPFLRGRNFGPADRFTDEQLNHPALQQLGVAVVNAAFAARYFHGQEAIGRLLGSDEGVSPAPRLIVGVVGDVRGRAVAEVARPTVYVPHAQNPDVLRPSLVIRSTLPFDAIAAAVRDRIAAYDPQLLVLRMRPMDAVISGALARPRFNLLLLCSFAAVALALAAIGIYGVLAYLVAQRTREIGIRVALGARAVDVLRLILREAMIPVLVGGAVGMIASALATRTIGSLLFGVTPLDPVSLAGAPAILVGVALLACYQPARRALRVDPLIALRDE